MNLRQIEIFHAILQSGSISAAARALNVSQPNVTRVLAHAEQQLGFLLFERHAQGLSPTPEALRLMPEIEQLMRQRTGIDTLIGRLKRGEAQHLRIGAAHALGQAVLPQTLIEAHRRLPQLSIELVTGHWDTLCEDLLRQRMDLALAFGQRPPEGIDLEVLGKRPLMALFPPGVTPPERLGLDQLGEAPLLMQRQDPLGERLHAAIDAAGLELRSPWLIKTYAVIAEMVAAGAGIGVVDAFTAEHYRGRLGAAVLSPEIEAEVVLITPSRRSLSLPAQRLCELLRTQLAD
ncbi:LysR family transcriptional regulator [Halotalea alkalilenta]|uniref:LysR family transcriptional regulator n=1 Tax=Halotalea alkalilenta TaxID=376489 RepID=UPI000480337A|nr:LysR family transcriptional regulator [Halotalea alkalilenta]